MPIVPAEAFPFCGPTYSAASPVINAERCINLYPEPASASSKTRVALIGRPGLSPSPAFTLASSPARALWAGNNRLFAVGGTSFQEIGGSSYGAMPSSGGVGPCQIIANGTQLLVCDPSAAKVYIADPTGPVMTPVFNGVALEYLDGFYISIAYGASLAGSNPNQINVSKNGDGTVWDPLNYVIRTGAADLTTNLAVLNGQLWIFGQKSIEVWFDAGNNGFPFARISGATINLGLLSPYSVVKFNNTIMWLAADDRGYSQVYMTQGLSPVRVSNFGVEGALLQQAVFAGPSSYAYGYQENGHTFYVLCIAASNGVPFATLVYDLTTGMWHERAFAGPTPCCFSSVTSGVGADSNYVGDSKSANVYGQSTSYPSDGGSAITYIRNAPHVSNENKWTKYPRLELDGDFGTAAPMLSYSNDGGRSFLTGAPWPYAMRQAQDAGSAGTFRRFFAMQLGRSRDRVFNLKITDSTNLIRIANAYLTAEGGTE